MSGLAGKAALVGIGQTEFSKESGRSEMQLACEAVKAAIADAGLKPSDVDGMVTFTVDENEEIEVARNVGIKDLTFFTRVPHGGGAAAGTVLQAAMAVATGVAEVVVCYRAFNERSGFRFGGAGRQPGVTPLWMAPYAPFALMTPAGWVALHAQRYMNAYGVTNADFGKIAVIDRKHAAKNPDAWFYEKPITLEQHQESRWIIEPVLRLLDCCQESDGGVAMVVTSVERARDLAKPPAVITAAAQGAAYDGEVMTSYYREEITGLPEMGVVGEKLWGDSGLKPADISTAFLYDHFTPFVFTQLEELGFCGRGEAKDFVSVDELSLGGRMPINTNGGLLGEAYIHGMNGITEGVRQVRGTSYNQVDNVEHVLVTSGTGVPTSGLDPRAADHTSADATEIAVRTHDASDRDRHPGCHHLGRLRVLSHPWFAQNDDRRHRACGRRVPQHVLRVLPRQGDDRRGLRRGRLAAVLPQHGQGDRPRWRQHVRGQAGEGGGVRWRRRAKWSNPRSTSTTKKSTS